MTVGLMGGCSSENMGPPPAPPVNWHSFEVGSTRDAGPPGPTAREQAVAESYVEALDSVGFAQLGTHLDDDARFAFPGLDDVHGREPIVRAHDSILGAFDARKVIATRIWRTSSEQTVEWSMTATHARDWMGVAPTHKAVTFKGLSLLWTKDDGTISDVHLYFDVAAVKAQLGVGPKGLILGLQPDGGATSASPPVEAAAGPAIFEQTGSTAEASNVAAVRASLDALEGNDETAYLQAFADDAEVRTAGRAQPMRGKGDLRAFFKAMHKAIGQLDTTVTDSWGVGTYVVLEYTVAGEELGPIGWLPFEHDKAIRIHVVDVVEVQAGKMKRVWRYDNPSEIVASTPS
ncbi:MAG: nuclear transport factor 2 family protein [Polyangiaceae bacterium]